MDRKKVTLLFTVVALTIVGLVTYSILKPKNADEHPNQKFISTIVHEFPELIDDSGNPVIGIESIDSYENGWHLVAIKSINETSEFIPVFVVLREHKNALNVVVGPDTHFTETEMLKYNIPDSIIRKFSSI